MRDAVCEFVEPDVQSKLSNSWGIDEEGELIGAYKFSGCESRLGQITPQETNCMFDRSKVMVRWRRLSSCTSLFESSSIAS